MQWPKPDLTSCTLDTGHFFYTIPIQYLIFWAYFNVKNSKFGHFLRASEAGKKK